MKSDLQPTCRKAAQFNKNAGGNMAGRFVLLRFGFMEFLWYWWAAYRHVPRLGR